MIKRNTFYCDKCGKKQGQSGCEIITDPKGAEGAEHIDLCGKCWQAAKKFFNIGTMGEPQ